MLSFPKRSTLHKYIKKHAFIFVKESEVVSPTFSVSSTHVSHLVVLYTLTESDICIKIYTQELVPSNVNGSIQGIFHSTSF